MPKQKRPAAASEQPAPDVTPDTYTEQPDPAVNSPDALAQLAANKARAENAAIIRSTYNEQDIAACVRYGYHIDDVPTLIDTRDTFWQWLKSGTEGYLALGENLSAIKEGMHHGKWTGYCEWIGLDPQAASRMIGAWAATQSWPALAAPAMVERIDQSAYGKVIGQGRDRITEEVVDRLVNRAAATGKVNEADAREILNTYGLPPPVRTTAPRDPDLGMTRMDPQSAALNAETMIAAFATFIMEGQRDGVQPGLVRLTPGFKAFIKEATDPVQPAKTEFVEMIRQWLVQAYRWGVSAGELLTLYVPDRVEAGTYNTTPTPEWGLVPPDSGPGYDPTVGSTVDVIEGEVIEPESSPTWRYADYNGEQLNDPQGNPIYMQRDGALLSSDGHLLEVEDLPEGFDPALVTPGEAA